MDTKHTPTILTIGYAQRQLDEFIQIIGQHHIQFVVDVRSVPYSQFRPEFSRRALEQSLMAARHTYIFMGDLLGARPDDQACYRNGKVDYDLLGVSASYLKGIQRLKNAWQRGLRVCLLCAEGRPEDCHRSKLTGQTLAQHGIPVGHIDPDGFVSSQAEVMLRLTGGQQGLFGPG